MVDILRVTAGALGCLFIVAFQLQLLPFFERLFVDNRTLWPIIYHGCSTLVIATTLLLLILQRSILMRALPVLMVCAASAALTFVHPVDLVAKSFLTGTAFVACGSVLAIASAPLALLRFSATATLLSAVICLLDIFFSNGFTKLVGRAAGLSIHPNAAAAVLFLGAASSHWAVPPRLRTTFLLIIGAAILVTLSRSILIATVVVCSVVAADLIWTRLKGTDPRRPLQWASGSAMTLLLAAWIALALFTNDRFSVAATNSFLQIGTSLSALEEARDSVAKAVQSKTAGPVPRPEAPKQAEPPKQPEVSKQPAAPKQADVSKQLSASSQPASLKTPTAATSPREGPAAIPNPSISDEVAEKRTSQEIIREIGRRAENEGDINSISARGILLERAYLSYKVGPALGQGLGAAHALQPHNMFLLFAVAFGPVGWLVPLAFLSLTAWWTRSIQQLPLFLATFAVMMTSHDVLFTLGLLAPIVFGIAGLNWLRYPLDGAAYTLHAMPYAALAAPLMFAVGSIVIASTAIFTYVPLLLSILVFCAFTLWSACIWFWRGKLTRQTGGVARGY